MELIDGRKVSQTIKDEIAAEVLNIKTKGGKVPHLAVILVGNDGGSRTYVNSKVKTCGELGFKSTKLEYTDTISEQELLDKIHEINNDKDIDGLLIQLPLPEHISETKVLEAIDPAKDVDGFHQ